MSSASSSNSSSKLSLKRSLRSRGLTSRRTIRVVSEPTKDANPVGDDDARQYTQENDATENNREISRSTPADSTPHNGDVQSVGNTDDLETKDAPEYDISVEDSTGKQKNVADNSSNTAFSPKPDTHVPRHLPIHTSSPASPISASNVSSVSAQNDLFDRIGTPTHTMVGAVSTPSRCPLCTKRFSPSEDSPARARHVNKHFNTANTNLRRSPVVAALSLQDVPVSADEHEDKRSEAFCYLCHQDISHLSSVRRGIHINRCLDAAESAPVATSDGSGNNEVIRNSSLNTLANQDKSGSDQIPSSCPMCAAKLSLSRSSRVIHLKRCASMNNVSPAHLIGMLHGSTLPTPSSDGALLGQGGHILDKSTPRPTTRQSKRRRQTSVAILLPAAPASTSTSIGASKDLGTVSAGDDKNSSNNQIVLDLDIAGHLTDVTRTSTEVKDGQSAETTSCSKSAKLSHTSIQTAARVCDSDHIFDRRTGVNDTEVVSDDIVTVDRNMDSPELVLSPVSAAETGSLSPDLPPVPPALLAACKAQRQIRKAAETEYLRVHAETGVNISVESNESDEFRTTPSRSNRRPNAKMAAGGKRRAPPPLDDDTRLALAMSASLTDTAQVSKKKRLTKAEQNLQKPVPKLLLTSAEQKLSVVEKRMLQVLSMAAKNSPAPGATPDSRCRASIHHIPPVVQSGVAAPTHVDIRTGGVHELCPEGDVMCASAGAAVEVDLVPPHAPASKRASSQAQPAEGANEGITGMKSAHAAFCSNVGVNVATIDSSRSTSVQHLQSGTKEPSRIWRVLSGCDHVTSGVYRLAGVLPSPARPRHDNTAQVLAEGDFANGHGICVGAANTCLSRHVQNSQGDDTGISLSQQCSQATLDTSASLLSAIAAHNPPANEDASLSDGCNRHVISDHQWHLLKQLERLVDVEPGSKNVLVSDVVLSPPPDVIVVADNGLAFAHRFMLQLRCTSFITTPKERLSAHAIALIKTRLHKDIGCVEYLPVPTPVEAVHLALRYIYTGSVSTITPQHASHVGVAARYLGADALEDMACALSIAQAEPPTPTSSPTAPDNDVAAGEAIHVASNKNGADAKDMHFASDENGADGDANDAVGVVTAFSEPIHSSQCTSEESGDNHVGIQQHSPSPVRSQPQADARYALLCLSDDDDDMPSGQNSHGSFVGLTPNEHNNVVNDVKWNIMERNSTEEILPDYDRTLHEQEDAVIDVVHSPATTVSVVGDDALDQTTSPTIVADHLGVARTEFKTVQHSPEAQPNSFVDDSVVPMCESDSPVFCDTAPRSTKSADVELVNPCHRTTTRNEHESVPDTASSLRQRLAAMTHVADHLVDHVADRIQDISSATHGGDHQLDGQRSSSRHATKTIDIDLCNATDGSSQDSDSLCVVLPSLSQRLAALTQTQQDTGSESTSSRRAPAPLELYSVSSMSPTTTPMLTKAASPTPALTETALDVSASSQFNQRKATGKRKRAASAQQTTATCATSTQVDPEKRTRLVQLIKNNPRLHLAALQYIPIDLKDLTSAMAANGLSCAKQTIIDILNEEGITYVDVAQQGSRRRKKR